ncbi:MAG: hypothetical protein EA392_06985 [Cryomorphaceae bacterium]|nr:MAG: hypothetical protein EA392_06985 [Cryomorphaceae bacterium]
MQFVMDIKAEKLDLIQWLLQLTDENVIAKIKQLRNEDADWWDSLSAEEARSIREGLEELDKGEGVPHDQVVAEAKKKYGL